MRHKVSLKQKVGRIELTLRRSKGPVAAEPSAAAVGGHNSEMIKVARAQAADVGSDRPGRIPSLSLHRGGVPVAGCRAPLEIDGCGQSMRIE